MSIKLSDHFTYQKLIRFIFPSVIMMIFTSMYSIVDGFFISNYAGKTAFAASSLIYPLIGILGALGFMMGTGGTAIVGKLLGEQKNRQANEAFSMLVCVTAIGGIAFAAVGLFFLEEIAVAFGAQGQMLTDSVLYSRLCLIGIPFFMLQFFFQSFFVTAEKPKLGLFITALSGVTNMVFDWLFIAVFHWGLAGAAIATVMGQMVGGILPLFYFGVKNSSLLRFAKPVFSAKVLLKTCTNGSSELMSNIATSVLTILYNFQLMRLVGENGVAAYGILMYVSFVFSAIFLGYAVGCAPVISFHYGAKNEGELKNLFGKSLKLTAIGGIVLTAAAIALADVLCKMFVGYDARLETLTAYGLRLFAWSFLFSGFNIFGSAFFTALNNGAVSAGISFLRTMVFGVASVLLLPPVLGTDGVWLASVAAELLSALVTAVCFILLRKKYRYF